MPVFSRPIENQSVDVDLGREILGMVVRVPQMYDIDGDSARGTTALALSADESNTVQLRGTGPTALHLCLTMLTQAGIWNYSLIRTSGFDKPFFLVFIKSVDMRAVMYRMCAAAGDQDADDDEKRPAGRAFVRSVWDDGSVVFPRRQMTRDHDVSRDLPNAMSNPEFLVNRHVRRGGLAVGYAYGQEALTVGGGLLVNNGSREVCMSICERYADVRASQAEKPVADLDPEFETCVNTDEEESTYVIVFSGSTNQQWVSAVTTDRRTVEYDGLNGFQDQDEDKDEKSEAALTEHWERSKTQFVRSVWDRRTNDPPRERRVGVNALVNREFEVNQHARRGAPAVGHGQEAMAVGGSLVNHGSREVSDPDVRASQAHRPLQFAADERDPLVPAVDDLELKFQTYVNTDKTNEVHVIVASGSTRHVSDQLLRRWERAYYCFDLAGDDPNLADALSDMILDAIQGGTLFELEPRGGGDHNSVVVLTNDDFRWHLIRVKRNTDNFDERPLVNPRENHRSASRMLKYGRMLTLTDERSLLAAAISTRHYFGSAFDKVFRSYSHFCDLMVGKRADASIDDVQQTAANLMMINREVWDVDRFHGHIFGGDRSGPFETKTDEVHAMEDAIANTRRCDGTLELLYFPNSPHEISIFYAGKRYPMRLEQVREAALSFCEVGIGTVASGLEVVCVNTYLNGDISYCVPVESEFESDDINEFEVVYGHHLFP